MYLRTLDYRRAGEDSVSGNRVLGSIPHKSPNGSQERSALPS